MNTYSLLLDLRRKLHTIKARFNDKQTMGCFVFTDYEFSDTMKELME